MTSSNSGTRLKVFLSPAERVDNREDRIEFTIFDNYIGLPSLT